MTLKLAKETLHKLNGQESRAINGGNDETPLTEACPMGDICKGCNTKEGPCCSACRCDPSMVIGCKVQTITPKR